MANENSELVNKPLQICTSKSLKFFHNHAIRRYGFTKYTTKKRPAVFYGCYELADVNRIKIHFTAKYLIWGGSDILRNHIVKEVKKIPKLIHIAQSKFIARTLRKHKIKHYYLPFAPTVDFERFQPTKKGKGIYIYTSAANPDHYGRYFYNQIRAKYPKIPFYVYSNAQSIANAKKEGKSVKGIRSIEHSQIHRVYKNCFLCLRLTKHDGISATVQELGLMGIKTIHNGSTPSAVNYSNLASIYRIIDREIKTIGQTDEEMSAKVKEHLDLDIQKLIREMKL